MGVGAWMEGGVMKSRFTYWLTMVAGGVALSAAILAATDGPLTPWGNLRGRTDDNGYVMVSAGTPGTTDGPLTLFPQLRTRTDENGYLRVALSGGAVIPSANCYGWSTDTFLQRVAAANVGVSATCGGANTGTLTAGVVTASTSVSAPFVYGGGTTSSFVAWKRSGTSWQARLGDDSGYADVTVQDSITQRNIYLGSASCKFGVGSGSPEGVVTAPTCSIYLNTAGGASTTLYVKTSGAGNTGWTAK